MHGTGRLASTRGTLDTRRTQAAAPGSSQQPQQPQQHKQPPQPQQRKPQQRPPPQQRKQQGSSPGWEYRSFQRQLRFPESECTLGAAALRFTVCRTGRRCHPLNPPHAPKHNRPAAARDARLAGVGLHPHRGAAGAPGRARG
jgi:hypothetical protein